jgi:hypothetical protein
MGERVCKEVRENQREEAVPEVRQSGTANQQVRYSRYAVEAMVQTNGDYSAALMSGRSSSSVFSLPPTLRPRMRPSLSMMMCVG